MARVSADTMKTATAPKRNGRRPTNGNAAQSALSASDSADADDDGVVTEAAEPETAPAAAEPAATAQLDNGLDGQTAAVMAVATAQPRRGRPPKASKTAREAYAGVELGDEDLITLGKMTRMAIEYGIPIDELATKLAHMVEVYEIANANNQ